MAREMAIGDTVAELTKLQDAGVLLTSRSLQVGREEWEEGGGGRSSPNCRMQVVGKGGGGGEAGGGGGATRADWGGVAPREAASDVRSVADSLPPGLPAPLAPLNALLSPRPLAADEHR